MDYWDQFLNQNNINLHYYDLTITQTSKLNDLAPVLKEFTDRLVDTYQKGTQQQRELIDQCTANAVKVDGSYPLYDFAKYMVSLFDALPEVFDDNLFSRLSDAFNACIVKQRFSDYLTTHDFMVDYSVILAAEGNCVYYEYDDIKLDFAIVFNTDGRRDTYQYKGDGFDNISHLDKYELQKSETWPSTFANTYQQTTFDRLVGWSRFLLLNQTEPPAWSLVSLNSELP